jgi:hypothetical protein
LSHDGVVFLVEESWITISLDLHLLDEWLLIDDIVNEQCIKEINFSLGLSATVDKSTHGKLQRDQSLVGPLSDC